MGSPSEQDALRPELPDMRGPLNGAPARASIVVPLYGGLEYTQACLASLAACWDPRDQLVLVDNASPDETGMWLDEIAGRVVVQRNDTNRNFSGACNDGAALATGDLLVFLNNDVEVCEGWLDPLVAAARVPGTGLVGTLLTYPDGLVQHAGVALSGRVDDEIAFHVHARRSPSVPVVRRAREMQAVTAACVVVPAAVFAQLEGFDEGYVNGLEDIDLCLRAREAGLRVWYEPGPGITHHESVTEGRFQHARANILRFLERWATQLVPDAHAHDDAVVPQVGYPEGVDVLLVDAAAFGGLGPACNHALCEGDSAHVALVLAPDIAPGAADAFTQHATTAAAHDVVVLEPGASAGTLGAIVLPRATVYAVGGVDLNLPAALQLTDWVDRMRLHGWRIDDRTGGALDAPAPWHGSAATVGRQLDQFVRRWGRCDPALRRRSIYEPLVWEPQLEHAAAEMDLRERAALLAWCDEPGAFAAALETLLTSIATTDDVSIVVRVDPRDSRGIELLDEIADRVAATRSLPDVVLIEGGPEQDLALASAVDLAVAVPGPAGARIASIAHSAGCAVAPADDAAQLLGMPVDELPLPPIDLPPHSPVAG